jgi:hypothetical protein
VAEQEEKSVSIPWVPLITLIGLGSGVLFLSFQQLTSSRPGGGDPRLMSNTFDDQSVDARLWQDPLGVVVAEQEKNQKNNGAAHSVERFQNIVIKKCFDSLDPLGKEFSFEEQANRLQILGVMIPGGPYVEDVERRLRSRRAVIEGLGIADYDPEKDHEIGYFFVPWLALQDDVVSCVAQLEENRNRDESCGGELKLGLQSTRRNQKQPDAGGPLDSSSLNETGLHNLFVPYEWFEPRPFASEQKSVAHVLVLWLTDDAFREAPLARLADLISWFRLKFAAAGSEPLKLSPVFSVLGPDNSGSLHKMVLESKKHPWNDDTRDCLATTQIYSSQAAAAESKLLGVSEHCACQELIEQQVRGLRSNGFSFQRTILLDDRIVTTLWQELERRGVKLDDHVAIISEEDTLYARALCSSFMNPDLKTIPPNVIPANVHSYTYLRGIDGNLPSEAKDQKETKEAESVKNTTSSSRPTERTEGMNQADDLRRLAVMLQTLDRDLSKEGGLKAVGLLGSDVYDKLELLKALRPMLPEAVFFTNNLDARLAHPDEWRETHNLVVVSAHDLSLKRELEKRFQKVPPFRDSGETALFEATLEATKRISVKNAIPESPFVFEIGRNGAMPLSVPNRGSIEVPGIFHFAENSFLAWSQVWKIIAAPLHFFGACLPGPFRPACFIVLGILFLTWVWFVSRVTPTNPNTKAQSEK